MHQVVTAQLAAARQGTHKTKTRGEVRGGGSQALAPEGHRPCPAGLDPLPPVGRWRRRSRPGAQGLVGPGQQEGQARALRSALTDRANNDLVTVVRASSFDAPRTKDAVTALSALGLEGKVLVVLAERDEATMRSFRNLPNVHTLVVDQLNTHDVLVSDRGRVRRGRPRPDRHRSASRRRRDHDPEEVSA
jgi:large subunit ribosomal protein L4